MKQTKASDIDKQNLFLALYALLGIRLVQGWIYWGGGSRRFIFDPAKLDPHSESYMGLKLLHAAPGAAFGMGSVIDWLVLHPSLLHGAILFFSACELIFGGFLLLGFLTRFSAFVSVGLSVFLMLTFGWLGTTCVDEWTMASCNFAMGMAIIIGGAGPWALDNQLRFSPWLSTGPIPLKARHALLLSLFSFLFCVFFYNYYRGEVITPPDTRTSAKIPGIALNNAIILPNGALRFKGYINAGPDVGGLYIINVAVKNQAGNLVESWDGEALKDPKLARLDPLLPYSEARYSAYGWSLPLASQTVFSLLPSNQILLASGSYALVLTNIMNQTYEVPLTFGLR